MKKMNKCDKCDDRGMISEGSGASHSCECGYSNKLMEEVFKNVSLGQLLTYGQKRREEKIKQTNN